MNFPERPHLTNSRPLRWTRRATGDSERNAIDSLLELLEASEDRRRKRRADDRLRLRAALEAVLLELYRAAKKDRDLFLSYSRRKEEYEGEAHGQVSLTSVRTVVAYLEESGFAETRLGSYSRRANPFAPGEVGSGYLSRIRATPLFVETLEASYGVTLAGIGANNEPHGRLIRLKAPPGARGSTKQALRFKETNATRAMRERVGAGNRLRSECSLAFDGEAPDGVDQDDVYLYRVFNNGRWDHGGRFYGGWWQSLGKEDRSRILIDGETTVELDFRAHQPRLSYHLVGQPLPSDVDPYAIPGFDLATYRDVTKRAFGQLLNSAPGHAPRRPSGTKELFRTPKDYAVFIARVEEAWMPIQSWLRAGRGMEMQFIDSEIADEVLHLLTAQGVPCLPVHDSFIVPSSAELELGRAMFAAYDTVASSLADIRALPVIAGWTSGRMEQNALLSVSSSDALLPNISLMGSMYED